MRPRDEVKLENIRAKAIEMIVQEGFEGLSMQKLAKAVNISPATLYIYYENREAMIQQLFDGVHELFSTEMLLGFDPMMNLKEGLWTQWKNRLAFVNKYPLHFAFMDQFMNASILRCENMRLSEFKKNMRTFVQNAIERKELRPMEPEIFWSLAYGPLYALINFHLGKKTIANRTFKLNETRLKETFDRIIISLTNHSVK